MNKLTTYPLGKVGVNWLQTLKKLSICLPGKTPSAPSVMGVGDPRDLPSKWASTDVGKGKVLISHVRVLGTGYKSGWLNEGRDAYPPTSQMLLHEAFIACTTYAQEWWEHTLGLHPPPAGPLPPGYDEYLCLSSGGIPSVHHSQPTHQYIPPAPAPTNLISMPPEAFNHLINSQVHMMEIVTNYHGSTRRDDWVKPRSYSLGH